MGVETLATALDPTGFSSSALSGAKKSEAAREQAETLERENKEKAEQMKKENKKFLAKQELSFLKSGVILDGSPLMILNQSASDMSKDLQNLKNSGRVREDAIRRSGRNYLTSGFSQGIETARNRGTSAISMGM